VLCGAAFAAACTSQAPDPTVAPQSAPKAQSGPYAVTAEGAFGAPALRTFRPASVDAFPERDTMPVIVWGNGGCVADAPLYAGFLTTIASHGFLVITTAGAAQPAGSPVFATPGDLKAAIDWAERENARAGSPLQGRIETRRVAVMGQSCGGFLAMLLGADPRVSTIGVLNSGLHETGWRGWLADGGLSFRPIPTVRAPQPAALKSLHGPVLLINGGDTDFMKGPSRAAYEAIDKLPVFYGSRHGAGHAASVFYPGGGEFANVASSWALWQLKQDPRAGAMFVGPRCGLCSSTDWDVESKRLAP
jgi:dienelactone hydrolase